MIRIPKFDFETHMPFIVDDDTVLLCRAYIGRIWKLHLLQDGELRRIHTGLPASFVECSPSVWVDAYNVTHLTFISGPGWHSLSMYELTCSHIAQLANVPCIANRICVASTGYHRHNQTVFSLGTGELFVFHNSAQTVLSIEDTIIVRTTFTMDVPHRLLISGENTKEHKLVSFEYDLVSHQQYLLECDDQVAYKCCAWRNEMLYVNVENNRRQVLRPESVTRFPCNLAKIGERINGSHPSSC